MHAVCAGLDHVAAVTGEPQETVGIEVAEVAGAQPAVDQGRGGRLRRVPVPGHDVVAAGTDLASLARRSFTDRKRVVSGKSGSVRVYIGGRRITNKNTNNKNTTS